VTDQRTRLEKLLWERIGPPLYYCADCLRAVTVRAVEGAEPEVARPCGPECGAQIIAPRKAVVSGKGGVDLPLKTRAAIKAGQIASSITGRSV
jgi:hypothetical protein